MNPKKRPQEAVEGSGLSQKQKKRAKLKRQKERRALAEAEGIELAGVKPQQTWGLGG